MASMHAALGFARSVSVQHPTSGAFDSEADKCSIFDPGKLNLIPKAPVYDRAEKDIL